MKQKKFSIEKYEQSNVSKVREYGFKKGFELVNITRLCEFKLGCSLS